MRSSALEEGGRWLEQARHDLRWAEHLAREGAHHIACFLAQQVAEKALKGFLYAQGIETVFGHSVQRLAAEAAPYDRALADRARRWTLLDAYYIPTRYPNGLPESIPALVFTREAADSAVGLAREAVEEVGRRLAASSSPDTGQPSPSS